MICLFAYIYITYVSFFLSYCHIMTVSEKMEHDDVFSIAYRYMIYLATSSYLVSLALSQYDNVRGN